MATPPEFEISASIVKVFAKASVKTSSSQSILIV